MSANIAVTEADIRAIIQQVVSEEVAVSLAPDQSFLEAGLDSLERAQILIQLEEDFGVSLSDDDFENCNSIADILKYARP